MSASADKARFKRSPHLIACALSEALLSLTSPTKRRALIRPHHCYLRQQCVLCVRLMALSAAKSTLERKTAGCWTMGCACLRRRENGNELQQTTGRFFRGRPPALSAGRRLSFAPKRKLSWRHPFVCPLMCNKKLAARCQKTAAACMCVGSEERGLRVCAAPAERKRGWSPAGWAE